jgi:hypothetical protein
MNPEFLNNGMNDEMQALLSAYATGTLTDEERKRLFARAAEDQELFDELMETETMRAAVEGPLAKRALLRALEEAEEDEAALEERPMLARAAGAAPVAMPAPAPISIVAEKSRRGLWVALAACLAVGTVGLYRFFEKPAVIEVAQAPAPAPAGGGPKGEAAESAAPAGPATASPVAASPGKNGVAKSTSLQRKDEPKRFEAPQARQAPVPAVAVEEPPALAAENKADEKKALQEIAQTLPRVGTAAPAPPRSSAPSDEMVFTLRDAEKADKAAKNESRERSALGAAKQLKAARAVGAASGVARVVGSRLELPPASAGQLYVFRSEGARFRRVYGLAPLELAAGGERSFALPQGIAGTLFVLVAPQRDAELDRLADPHEGALPVRTWTRIVIP